jgi:uncharacterized membrane protein YbaN (DUF454 family)
MSETTASRTVTVAPPAARPSVRIATSPGAIRITALVLFARNDPSVVHRLVEGLLRVEAVETVEIDHATGEVVVGYDRRKLGHAAALSSISIALRDDKSRSSRSIPPQLDLIHVVGKVIRIERRQRRGGVLMTVFSAGADFLAAVSHMIVPASPGRAQRNERPADKAVLRNGLAIRYLPHRDGTRLDTHPKTVVIVQGWRRVANLAAAGGCFFLSFVGLVTPGIPTVPFVLATSYFLVRSSPALDERLRRSRLLGQLVRDWTAYNGMRPSTKRNVVLLTLTIMGGTLVFVEPSAPILIVIGVMGTLGVSVILLTRTVPEDAPDDRTALIPA